MVLDGHRILNIVPNVDMFDDLFLASKLSGNIFYGFFCSIIIKDSIPLLIPHTFILNGLCESLCKLCAVLDVRVCSLHFMKNTHAIHNNMFAGTN